MFESFEMRAPRNSVVQPVLALAVHAGLISLALNTDPVSLPGHMVHSPDSVIYIPVSTDHVGTGSLAAPLIADRIPPGPARIPGLPMMDPIRLQPVALVARGGFDPNSLLAPITGTDSVTSGSNLVEESALTEPPQALHLAEPVYPDALRQAGVEGAVSVTYVVDPSGFVEAGSIRIVSSSHPAFAEAVLAAVGKAQFTPGRIHGRAVRVLVRQTIRFATRS